MCGFVGTASTESQTFRSCLMAQRLHHRGPMTESSGQRMVELACSPMVIYFRPVTSRATADAQETAWFVDCVKQENYKFMALELKGCLVYG